MRYAYFDGRMTQYWIIVDKGDIRIKKKKKKSRTTAVE